MRLFKKKSTTEEMRRAPGFPSLSGASYREVLNALESALSPEIYFEIGSRSGTSLKDRSCSFVAIDPEFQLGGKVFNEAPMQLFFQMTSDAFFEGGFADRMAMRPKLSFIDGMHLIEFVLRDFRNIEALSDPDGAIALHDVLPFNNEMTTRDVSVLETASAWTGDVWKIIPILQEFRPDLTLDVIGAPRTGLLVVRNLDCKNRILFDAEDEILARFQEMDIRDYGAKTFFDAFTIADPAEFIQTL
jgi:hypothetical protein